MANTEGIPDEKLASLFSTADISDRTGIRTGTSTQKKIPRGLIERQRMIDAFESEFHSNNNSNNDSSTETAGMTMRPSATVIRSSRKSDNKRTVRSTNAGTNAGTNTGSRDGTKRVSFIKSDHGHGDTNTNAKNRNGEGQGGDVIDNNNVSLSGENTSTHKNTSSSSSSSHSHPPPVLLSESIKERPIQITKSQILSVQNTSTKKKQKTVSRFKSSLQKEQQNKNTHTNTHGQTKKHQYHKTGFPSFDRPIGSLTRKGRDGSINNDTAKIIDKSMLSANTETNTISNTNKEQEMNSKTQRQTQTEADSMIANMTKEEIDQSVSEIESVLSVETIKFLRNRKKKKDNAKDVKNVTANANVHTVKVKDRDKNSGDNKNDIVKTSMNMKNMNKNKEENKLEGRNTTVDSNDAVAISNPHPNTTSTTTATTTTTTTESDISINIHNKERMARLLSNIQSEQELDEIFAKTMGIHDDQESDNGLNTTELETETELDSATKLLRSTALRQRVLGAKTICELLERRFQTIITERGRSPRGSSTTSTTTSHNNNGPLESMEDYPILLPVALRCLLDLPSPAKHSILFSYVLRSLHLLVLLFSHPENHVYNSSSSSSSSSSGRNGNISSNTNIVDPSAIYQLYFMKDHVPTPPSSRLYTNSTIKTSPVNGESDTTATGTSNTTEEGAGAGAGYYSTNSSAESAEKDSEAFYADPLWTLLSRMRILPCLSHILTSSSFSSLLQHKANHINATSATSAESDGRGKVLLSDISVESLNAICSILSMLSLRSPGAACAIAQHNHIIPSIIKTTFEPISHDHDATCSASTQEAKHSPDGSGNFIVPTALTLPAIRLICALCRQSRTIALSSWISSVMESVTIMLAMSAEHDDEWEMQKWCIILWRTLLQYGLAISYTSTILTLSIPHLTTKDDMNYGLSPYYLTSYAALCDCAKTVANDDHTKNPVLDETNREVLSECSIWLASHVKSCVEFLQHSVLPASDDEVVRAMRLASARVRLMSSYTSAATSDVAKHQNNSSSGMIPLVSRYSCIQALAGVLRSTLLYKAIDITLHQEEIYDELSRKGCEVEASSCALVHSFFTALCSLLRQDNEEVEPIQEAENQELLNLINDIYVHVLGILATKSSARQNIKHFDNNSCVRSWRNKAHFSITRMMAITLSIRSSTLGIGSVKLALPLIQSFVFTLIGRLDHGEEAIAAMLISQSILFNVVVTEEGSSSFQSVRYVQEVLLREIMDTSYQSQVQLDHSFKLISGHEMSHNGGGSFQLESLRSEADRTAPPQSTAPDANDSSSSCEILSLPLGDDWLFKLLSGNIDLGNSHEKTGRLQCTSDIIFSAFRLIIHMEKEKTQYARSTASGAKIYFLLNSCLFPEDIVRQDSFAPLFHQLFNLYESSDESKRGDNDKARSFILTCFKHSEAKTSHHQDSVSEDQVLQLFYDHSASFTTDGDKKKKVELSPKCMKAMDDFVSDMCTAFIDYGAQYDIFTRSIRFFLISGFPSRNRIIILNTLKDLLNLLTTEDEMEQLGISLSGSTTDCPPKLGMIQQDLKRSLSGGLPMQDGSSRDAPELLDTIASLLKRDKCNTLESGGFFYLYGTGYLARNLASSAVKCECGLNAMRQRFLAMTKGGSNYAILDDTVSIALALMKDPVGNVDALAKIIVEICCNRDASAKLTHSNWEETWDTILLDLRNAFSSNLMVKNKEQPLCLT